MDERIAPPIRGRGAAENPTGRFERLEIEWESEAGPAPAPATRALRDPSRTILAWNDSPDVPFEVSVNPYRGCEHGCVYCYARPTHEYLGFSAGLDFETRILVKENAPALLRRALLAPAWRPRVVALGGVTDVYQPIERRTRLTRRCLEVFEELRNPVGVVTKSGLVLRDRDVLARLAEVNAAAVYVSITTLDGRLQRAMEPRAAAPRRRLATVAELSRSGIPVGVLVAPVVPGLTEHEIPSIVDAAVRAGARSVRFMVLRLPHGVKQLFGAWLDRHFPEKKRKVLNRLLAMRGDRLDDPRFHHRMRGQGFHAEQIQAVFDLACRRSGASTEGIPLSVDAFRRPPDAQLSLFSEG